MLRFFKKYRIQIDVFGLIVFALLAAMNFYRYYTESENSKMRLIGAIVFGLLAIMRMTDIFEYVKQRKKIRN